MGNLATTWDIYLAAWRLTRKVGILSKCVHDPFAPILPKSSRDQTVLDVLAYPDFEPSDMMVVIK